jgi:RNA polymerase sigma factor (sigma-70 family)
MTEGTETAPPEARAGAPALAGPESGLERFRARLRTSETAFDAGLYLRDLEKRPDTEEIDRLARLAKQGDPDARERLIEGLLPRIAALARDYSAPGLEHADLAQEGCVGLLRGLTRFDPARGTPFWAYASWWVREALQEARSYFLRPLRLPPKALAQLSQVKTSHASFYSREGHEPTLGELARESGVEQRQLEALLRADRRARSLSEELEAGDGTIGMLGDLLEDPLSTDAYEEVLDSLAGRQVRALLDRLTEREREIVSKRFGLDGSPPERLVEVGERLGVTAERARQVEGMALAKLRQRAAGT